MEPLRKKNLHIVCFSIYLHRNSRGKYHSTVVVRLSGTRLTGKFDQPDLMGKKIKN